MKGFAAQVKSFVAELAVALMAAGTMFGGLVACGSLLDLDRDAAKLLALVFVVPLAFLVLTMKTVFPRAVPHRSYSLAAYVLLSQLLAATLVAVILEAMGECWDCRGNAGDIVFYAIAAGTPYGVVYAFFSKLFSKDVDTLGPAV